MTPRSAKLKKRPDPKKLLTEARKAVAPDLKPAAPPPQAAAPAPKKRGRKPGVTFPGGYKRTAQAPKPATQDAPQAAPQEEAQPQGNSRAEDIFTDQEAGPAGAGQHRTGPQDGTRVNFGGFEINVADSVEVLCDVVFNQILASSRGEHWRLTPEKVKALAAPLADILDEILPGISANKWTYRIGAIAAVLGPSIFVDAMMHPHNYQWLNIFRKKPNAPESRPQTPDQEQPNAGSRPQGTGENLALEANPQTA